MQKTTKSFYAVLSIAVMVCAAGMATAHPHPITSGCPEPETMNWSDPIPYVEDEGISDAYVDWLNSDDSNRWSVSKFLTYHRLYYVDPADLPNNAQLQCYLHLLNAEYGFFEYP